MHGAAERADARMLETLLESGGDPDLQDADGRTPLILAALFPYDELRSQLAIRILLRFGAGPDLADNWGHTPLFAVAANHQQPTSARDLLAAGADPNKQVLVGLTPLHASVHILSKLSAAMVQALADGGARGDTAGARDETPLQQFVRDGSNDGRIVDALVDAGADVDARNPDGESPLHTAIRNGGSSENNRVVEALLAAGADPCIKDASGYTPYNTAREGGEVHAMLANAGGSDIGCQGSEDMVADYIVDPADWPGETTTRSNIRSGPGTDHDVVRTLDAGKFVHVTGTVRNTDWLEVDVAGSTAFIHASLVKEVEPYVTAQASDDAGQEAMEADHVRVATYRQLVCVDPDGELVDLPFEEKLPSLRSGACAGFLEIERTTSCDTRRWSCNLDLDYCSKPELSNEEFDECFVAWVDEPPSFARYEDDARALAEAARANRSRVRADSEARWSAHLEAPVILTEAGIGSEEDDAQTAAMLEEDPADESSLESAEPDSAPLSPLCPVTLGGDGCWMGISNKPGCYLWYTGMNVETVVVTWSGGCSDGKASGTGNMVSDLSPHVDVRNVMSGHGPFVNGKQHGDWKIVYDQASDEASITHISEGAYVEGEAHGRWVGHNDYGHGAQCSFIEWSHGEAVSGGSC